MAGKGCHCFGKFMMSLLIFPLLLIIVALSVAAVGAGRFQNWTQIYDDSVKPPYILKTGWYEYSGANATNANINITALETTSLASLQSNLSSIVAPGNPSLKGIGRNVWIVGLTCGALLCSSAVLAIIMSFTTLCGFAGYHMCCISVPFGVAVLAMQLGYYGIVVLGVREYTSNINRVIDTPSPDWAWCLGAVVGVVWIILGAFAACIPNRSIDRAKREDSQTSNYAERLQTSALKGGDGGRKPKGALVKPAGYKPYDEEKGKLVGQGRGR